MLRSLRVIVLCAVACILVTTGSARAASDAVSFFTSHKEPVEFRKSGQNLWFANQQIGIELVQVKNGFNLSRVYGISTQQDYLSSAAPAFWRLVFRQNKGRDKNETVISGPLGAASVSYDVESRDFTGVEDKRPMKTLHLRWNGISLPKDPGTVDVHVSITLIDGDPLSRWRIGVVNRSNTYGLWKVGFPSIELAPIGDPGINLMTLPHGDGTVVKDPFSNPIAPSCHRALSYPGWFNMQFQVLYNDRSKRGLYLAVYDGWGNRKYWDMKSRPESKSIRYCIDHFPANMGFPAEDFRMNYDVILSPLNGDWYDACQIYRQWATGQVWCGQGKIQARDDVPRWFKECPIALTCYTVGGNSEVITIKDRMLKLLKYFRMDLPVDWYGWKRYYPDMTDYNKDGSQYKWPERASTPCCNEHDGNYPVMTALEEFALACDEIGKAGGHVNAYVCASIFDQGLNENSPLAAEAKKGVIRDVFGSIQHGEERDDICWRMCPSASWWRDRMADTVTELIERENVDGIYFDAFLGGYQQCFDTNHGHSYGGGNEEYLGARKLSASARGAMKRSNPNSVMTAEFPTETMIDLIDACLDTHTYQRVDLPLFSTVYNDYSIRFGTWLYPESEGFYVQCASLFTRGEHMGRLPLHVGDYAGDKLLEEKMRFLKKLANYRGPNVGLQYVGYGQLLRPVSFTTPTPMPMLTYVENAEGIGEVTKPALWSGVFGREDGSLGIFIVNASSNPIPFIFELTPDRYPISALTSYTVSRVDESGQSTGIAVQKGKVAVTGTISGHDVTYIKAVPR